MKAEAEVQEKVKDDINLQVIQDLINMWFMIQEEFGRYCDWVSEDLGNLHITLED